MKFFEKLDRLMEENDLSARSLCAMTGLSEPTLSRYRAGSRVPDAQTGVLKTLADALAEVSGKESRRILKDLLESEDISSIDEESLRLRLNTLIDGLQLNVTRLAAATGYAPSALYRIRTGSRTPSDPAGFASDVAEFTASEATPEQVFSIIRKEHGKKDPEEFQGSYHKEKDEKILCKNIYQYLTESNMNEKTALSFLEKLDAFDLNAYIGALHFPELKITPMEIGLPGKRHYTGLPHMMDAELDFLKATFLSKANDDVIMYSDMPMEEMAKDPDFPKRWMFGMAMLMKKGLRLIQIHNLDRSISDMMLGLESWIPMYMTGQVIPFYLPDTQRSAFLHLIKVSGSAALTGEAISGHHTEGRYTLYRSRADIIRCRKQAEQLLSCATPLMEIYRAEEKGLFLRFLQQEEDNIDGNVRWRSLRSSLPIYTLPENTLRNILQKNRVSESDAEKIAVYAKRQREKASYVLTHCGIHTEIAECTESDFTCHPATLDLAGLFLTKPLICTYEEYKIHLEQTKVFANENANFNLDLTDHPAFRNINIFIKEGEWAMVSKETSPSIHFVIRHPKLREAIEKFEFPIMEE